ncbi:MAG: citrate synthase [Stappiaceae bacterium]
MNKPAQNRIDFGLEGIVAAQTCLSDVRGAAGELIICGRSIEDLAGVISYEHAVAFLLQTVQPDLTEGDVCEGLAAARCAVTSVLPCLKAAPADLSEIELIRLGLDALPMADGTPEALQIIGAIHTLLAAAVRIKAGKSLPEPNRHLSCTEDLLTMLRGHAPKQMEVDSLERYLVTILDHGLNASTFAARVIASTGSDMRSAVSGAIGALKGPLHGGAPGPVLDMLDAIGRPENTDSWIEKELAKGNRLMGFGHRVYRTRDPRADVLKEGLKRLKALGASVSHAEEIEAAALEALARHKPDRPLDTNVEFYTAVLLNAIGIDRKLFTPLFAAGRAAGWCAHVLEQQQKGRLIRPSSEYIGQDPANRP